MSNINSEKAFDRAVDLVLHADRLANTWTVRLVTIQTSLVVAEGALLAWIVKTPGEIMPYLVIIIAVVGIATLLAMTNIIIREHDHGHAFIEMVKRTEGKDPHLWQECKLSISGVKFSTTMIFLMVVLVAAWITFIILVALLHFHWISIHKSLQAISIMLALIGTFMLGFGLKVRSGITSELRKKLKIEEQGLIAPSDVRQCTALIVCGLALISIAAFLQLWTILCF